MKALGWIFIILIIMAVMSSGHHDTAQPVSATKQAREDAQRDKTIDYIRRTSKTPGEAYRRTISEGFWTGFAEGMVGK